LDRLNAAAERLTKASHAIAETLYKSQQTAGGPAGAAGAAGAGAGAAAGDVGQAHPGGQGDVVDAEFVDVDDSKKPN
ncbi:MAG: hypothetical protein WA879_10705, partial [Candidatus Acidiferrales bacterium]